MRIIIVATGEDGGSNYCQFHIVSAKAYETDYARV